MGSATESKGRTCCVCGKKYQYCPNCSKDAGKPAWMVIFCGENCHEIYNVAVAWDNKNIDVQTAYERLSKVNMNGLTLMPETQEQVERIMKNGKHAAPQKNSGVKQNKQETK